MAGLNLIGKTFGRLTVVKECGRAKGGYVLWECACSCGNSHIVKSSHLTQGNCSSCGCLQAELNASRVFDDLTGKRFGRWAAISFSGRDQRGQALWLCRCDCGTEKVVKARYLKENSKSCGCLQKELAKSQLKANNSNRVYERGSEHKWWNPSLTDKDRRYQRFSTAVQNWRKSVFEKDDYTCQVCRVRGGSLVAHHIVPWTTSKELRFVPANGSTLCVKHHRAYHALHHAKTATPENFQQFLDENRVRFTPEPIILVNEVTVGA